MLHFDHNEIKEISGDFNDFMPNWKELYLQNNQIKTLDTSLVKSVSILDVSYNQITEAKFHDLKLTELLIGNNDLKVLTINENLEKLVSAGNQVNSYYVDLKENKKLKYLDLRDSKLNSKTEVIDTIMTLKQLTHLNLCDIPLNLHSRKACSII